MSGFRLAKSGGGFVIQFNGVASDISNDTGSPEIRQTISFTGAGNHKTTGGITGVGSPDSGKVSVTSVGHGLTAGQKVTISGTTSYNGDYIVQDVLTSNTYQITHADDGSETGTWTLHDDSATIINIEL